MKTNAFALAVLLSGTLGLMSCSSDKQAPSDPMKLTPPTFTKGENEVPWDLFEDSVGKTLDLEDRLKFKAVPQGSMTITASCLNKVNKAIQSEHTVPLAKDIAVYEFFSPKSLTQLWKENPLNCSFKFTAQNSSGSRHVFILQGVEITDINKHNIQMSMENSDADINIVFGLDRRVEFRMWGARYDTLVMQCEDARWTLKGAESTIPFTRIVANGPDADPSDPEHKNLLKRPSQSCRILTYENGNLNEISGLFIYAMTAGSPEIKITPSHTADLHGISFEIARIQVTNPMEFPVTLQIPKATGGAKFHIITVRNRSGMNPDVWGQSDFNGTGWTQISGGKSVSETESARLVELAPKESLVVVVSAAPRKVVCSGVKIASASLTEPFVLQIVQESENGPSPGPFQTVDLTKTQYYGPNAAGGQRGYRNDGPASCAQSR